MANSYLKSTQIKVFPSAFRNKTFDKESFLTTEGNFVNLANRITNVITNYLYEVNNTLYIVLGGYLFVVEKGVFDALETKPNDIWVGIDVGNYLESGPKTLSPVDGTGTAGDPLDFDVDTENDNASNQDDWQFIGLAYASSESDLENCSIKLHILELDGSTYKVYQPSTLNIATRQIRNYDANETLSIDEKFITKDLIVQGTGSKFEVNDGASLDTKTYKTILVDSNDKPINKSLSKTSDAIASALNSATLTYVDTVHQNADGSVVETRKNAVFAIGDSQGQFKIGTTNVSIKGLGTTATPTFDSITTTNSSKSINNLKIVGDSGIVLTGTNSTSLSIGSGKSLSITANTSISADTSISAATTISSTTSISGATNIYGAFSVSNSTAKKSLTILPSVDSTLTLAGTLTLPANITGDATFALIQTKSGNTITPGWKQCTSNSGGSYANLLVLRNSNGNVEGNITGNSATATQLATARTISLSNDLSGSANFDGSANVTISATIGASKVTNSMLAGSISNSKLSNSYIKIGSTTVNLGDTITNLSGMGTISATGAISTSSGGISCSSGDIQATNGAIKGLTVHATSDERLKENIKTFIPHKSILDLDVVEFDFKTTKSHHIGCIAQDLREICPEIVHEDENGYLSIEETKIVYLLLDEVKKLKKELEELRGK